MPRSEIDSKNLLDRLMDVFRRYGYEGASLSRIAEATGLQRASLYYRFPGGKAEMVVAALERGNTHFETYVLAPLAETGDPARRVKKMALRLSEIYEGGRQSCLFDTLSLGDESEEVRKHIERSLTTWRDAMARVARDAGLAPGAAQRRGEEALVGIQGALVVARGTGDSRPFHRVLKNLPYLLTVLPESN